MDQRRAPQILDAAADGYRGLGLAARYVLAPFVIITIGLGLSLAVVAGAIALLWLPVVLVILIVGLTLAIAALRRRSQDAGHPTPGRP